MAGGWSSDWLFWIGGGAIALAGATLLIWALVGDRSHGRRRCPKCWYDMSKSAPESQLRCPECGKVQRHEKRLFKTRRLWKWALVSLGIGLLAAFVIVQPKVRRDGWVSIVPTTVVILGLRLPDPTWALDEINNRGGFADWQWRWVRDICFDRYNPNGELSADARMGLIWMCSNAEHRTVMNGGAVQLIPVLAQRGRNDADPDVRIQCVEALAMCGDGDIAFNGMLAYLDDIDENVRQNTVLLLGLPAHWSDAALDRLKSYLDSDDPALRGVAAMGIGNAADIRSNKEDLVQLLLDRCRTESNEDALAWSITALGMARAGTDEIRALVSETLQHESDRVLHAALYLVRGYPDLHAEAIGPAFHAMTSDDLELRSAATEIVQRSDLELLRAHESELEALTRSVHPEVAETARTKLDELRHVPMFVDE